MEITRESAIDDEDLGKIAENNFQRILQKSAKIGYADGVSDGKEEIFQIAFNKGYSDGLRTGFELEKYNALSLNLEIDSEEKFKKL
ncbi:PREDICTED: uncharacterized protein LOC108966287 [Bactrocera latifrons]|uniref:uncharacterized protein LOC108966287 n=1 Tax=Bactrocera latifrons TaxID=174628 RepID=UPI0008DD6E4D|nr:PREDICTED: uncharacterized protein LOC108966287 [Bactrocera latifrons]